ncbi:MAG: hypothetical protein II442_07760, partial [Oscillospiraceae bacterium]|nr:hypothetical protein [Oscillospiraceae bacterium]
GAYELSGDLLLENRIESISIIGVPDEISLPELTEGRLPAAVGECAVEEELVSRYGLGIGEHVRVANDELVGIDPLLQKEYVITGIFRHPDHVSFQVPCTPYLMVSEDSFNREDLDGAFMKARILVDGTPENRFADAYTEAVQPVEDAVTAMADERAALRRERLVSEIEDRIREGQEQLDDAEKTLQDASAQIEQARADIKDAEQQLRDAEQDLKDAEQELQDAESEISDGKKKLDDSEGQLYAAQNQLDAAQQQLDEKMEQMAQAQAQAQAQAAAAATEQAAAGTPAAISGSPAAADPAAMSGNPAAVPNNPDAMSGNPAAMPETAAAADPAAMSGMPGPDPEAQAEQLRQAAEKLAQESAQLERMWNDWYYAGEEYLDGLAEIENARKKIDQGKQDVEQGKEDIEQGKRDLADGEQEYAQGQADYEDGKQQIADAQQELDDLGICHWVILNNRCNVGCDFVKTNADSLSSISLSFSLIFMGIGALVIYSTIARMVEEQQKLVGTVKAMGFYNREVSFKYLFFGVGATVIGVLLGILFSYFAMQKLLLFAEGIPLTFGTVPSIFLPVPTLTVLAGALALSVLAVLFAARTLLRSSAVTLMAGPQPKGMRGGGRVNSRKSLYSRLILRNMRTDSLRVAVTTVSIMGCCLLLVCGFNLKFAISRVNERQFGQIIRFEGELYYDSAKAADAEEKLRRILDREGLVSLAVKKEDLLFRGDDTISTGTVVVGEAEPLSAFYGMKDYETKEPLTLTDEGVLVSSGFTDYFDLHAGDSFLLYDAGMDQLDVQIAGVFGNYLSHRIFFTPAGYAASMGEAAENNCFLVKLGSMSLDELQQQVQDVPGFRSLKDATADRARFDIMSMILNVIIVTLLILAAVMVYFILMNLTMTYIQRKSRELTVMRVNGFSTRECIRYAAWDLVLTTLAGVALGLFFGIRIASWIERMLEGPYAQFVREPDLRTFLFSALITLFFSIVINGYALGTIRKLKLSDING